MEKCIPKINPKHWKGYITNKPLWMTHRAFKAKNKKYFYWKKFQESKLHADNVTYKKYQNRAVAEILKAKKSFEKKLSVNIKVIQRVFTLTCVVRAKLKLDHL